MEQATRKKRDAGWNRIEPGEIVLLAFAMSLLVALVAGITSGVVSGLFPSADVTFLKATGIVSVIVFAVLGCAIACAAD